LVTRKKDFDLNKKREALEKLKILGREIQNAKRE